MYGSTETSCRNCVNPQNKLTNADAVPRNDKEYFHAGLTRLNLAARGSGLPSSGGGLVLVAMCVFRLGDRLDALGIT